MKVGKFVTFEGIEGCGKSRQVCLLGQALEDHGVPFISTYQPGGTPFGEELRRILLRKNGPKREPLVELLLYLADRYQHLTEVIEPALARGQHVICDRYHDATLAYQGHARNIGFRTIDSLSRVLKLRIPDLTFVLDLEVKVGLRRARERNVVEGSEPWGRFEAESLQFHRRVREGYRLIAQKNPERVFVIDASGTPTKVFESVREILESKRFFT